MGKRVYSVERVGWLRIRGGGCLGIEKISANEEKRNDSTRSVLLIEFIRADSSFLFFVGGGGGVMGRK